MLLSNKIIIVITRIVIKLISYKVLVQSSYKLNANLRMNSLNIKFAEFSNFINSISNKVHILFKD